ncbi:cytochrome c biogenesis protein CcdA [Trueperella bonasi]|uniref:Cytochrome c biogenesis protein CcdA n=1 Tax=Trueperella bonasi TaxID=312286 RepID=A0ABT9NFU0_9ACTO|nr:cytochrome c biogenesis CcdA family protein [Trueperella bonasi]MDP9806070.1 cytochrome c biogenesis protein CcdA [Trueperella bonasi]
MDIGFVTAFVGGMLALLSPCAALLLPAFFASTINSGARLVLHSIVFYLGLIVVLVPLGVGAGAFGSLFVTHRNTLITASSVLLIVLGIAQIFGFGFDPGKLIPGQEERQSKSKAATGFAKTFLLGTTSGVAGFCAGPILGAVLTMAAASGSTVTAGLLLATYGAGMVVPLIVIVVLWRPLGERGRSVLRGRTFTMLGRQFHTTSVITGLLIVGIGVLFWRTNGLIGVPEIIPIDAQARLQSAAQALSHPIVEIVAIVLIAALILALWFRYQTRGEADKNDAEHAQEPSFAGADSLGTPNLIGSENPRGPAVSASDPADQAVKPSSNPEPEERE